MIGKRMQMVGGLAVAFAGSALATFAGIPAAPLVGSTIAVTIASLLKLAPKIPDTLRNLSFAVIGGTLGAGVTPDFYQDVLRFPVTIAGLAVTMAVIMIVCSLVLTIALKQTRETSILSTSPGALSYSLALALERNLDVRTIMVLQSIRLFLITMLMPPLLALFGVMDGQPAAVAAVLGLQASAAVLGLSAVAGFLFQRFAMPAAWLVAGLIVSAAMHGSGLVTGRFAESVTFAGFTIAGAVIGSRFSGISRGELRRLGLAGVATSGLAILISAVIALVMSWITGFSFAQIWIAYAPGGVEGMSAMALSLNLDPVFVATHHIFRIVALIALLPVLLRLMPNDRNGPGPGTV